MAADPSRYLNLQILFGFVAYEDVAFGRPFVVRPDIIKFVFDFRHNAEIVTSPSKRSGCESSDVVTTDASASTTRADIMLSPMRP